LQEFGSANQLELEVPMYRGKFSLLVGLFVASTCLGSQSVAWAAPIKAQRYTVKTPYSSIEAGAARIDVAANAQQISEIISDFGNYSKLSDKFDKSRVVGHSGANTDVYLQVPILRGAAKIWAVVRFEPIRSANGEQVLTGHMIKGNVDRLDATWRVRSVGDHQSKVQLEMLIVPKIPVPGSLVTGEVAYAADKAVTGVRDRAEH
jgi:ribosome-associated toxin RatA of RatAB toxin-antitoxin module